MNLYLVKVLGAFEDTTRPVIAETGEAAIALYLEASRLSLHKGRLETLATDDGSEETRFTARLANKRYGGSWSISAVKTTAITAFGGPVTVDFTLDPQEATPAGR